ncbi:hypothetical protein A9Q99_10650 [Gammaproteobacteria bacterium 45_16_T64]|nr:hypothetical protein A9Q99_10650 [Gammaproteobacteria bacterium 45_16_T64]
MIELFQHPDFLKYVSIPAVAAFVGWSTNWLAIQLMFVPKEFMGYQPWLLGWQGVIPSKAEKMAKVVVEKGLSALANVAEVYGEIDRELLAEQLVKMMDQRIVEYIDELMAAENSTLWENLPNNVRTNIYRNVRKQLPEMVETLLNDVGTNIDDLFDLEDMVVAKLTQNKELLNRIFQEAGTKEFSFIIQSGIYLGATFGVIQMVIWYFAPHWWILPLAGLFVGYFTNVIALKVIFEPLEPIKIGPFTIQGLFLKRQKEVAQVLCRITTQEVITINNILHAMLTGPKSERAKKIIQGHIRKSIDDTTSWGVLGVGNPLTKAFMGTQNYIDLKVRAADLAINIATEEMSHNQAFSDGQHEIIEKLLRERMESLSSSEFQEILRPAFKEDEWKLISVGAVLGLIAGFIQLFAVFGGA